MSGYVPVCALHQLDSIEHIGGCLGGQRDTLLVLIYIAAKHIIDLNMHNDASCGTNDVANFLQAYVRDMNNEIFLS